MKHSTQYLFDVPRSYFEPELTILCKKKIATAELLKAKISKLKEFASDDEFEGLAELLKAKISKLKEFASDDEFEGLAERYAKADEGHIHWQKLLGEE